MRASTVSVEYAIQTSGDTTQLTTMSRNRPGAWRRRAARADLDKLYACD